MDKVFTLSVILMLVGRITCASYAPERQDLFMCEACARSELCTTLGLSSDVVDSTIREGR